MNQDWNPQHYLAFADERTRPAADLLARIRHRPAARIADLGCGPGNSTALLAQTWRNADITGVDTSPAMLAQARETLPHARFVQADFTEWHSDAPLDIIFANASLQWASQHDKLLPQLINQLAANGVLAVQMPDNLNEPSHRLMRDTAHSPKWRDKMRGLPVRPDLPAVTDYYDILAQTGCRADIWRTAYHHVLPDVQSIVRWFGSTALRPYLNALDEAERAEFGEDYLARLRQAYPPRADGNILLTLPRLFVVAEKI
ncbi:trans-aconitate 2-methyltransferase [Conchiformibius kuhniae]|uniref:Trans-aconitate 2-methyltransferase n=1 Tax=Conchiformibius kuhniae TaxID=211502 RepID=A0A8T9MU37_9NEIS|nr:trans-aconitate 2-methyltransferase [Conchiformibius kuhniae]